MHPFYHFRALSWGFSVRPGERCEAPRRGVAGGRGTCSPDRRQGLDEHRRRRSFAAAGFGVPARSAICKASQKKSCIFPHASLMPPRPHQFGTLRSFVRGPKAKQGDKPEKTFCLTNVRDCGSILCFKIQEMRCNYGSKSQENDKADTAQG